MDDDHKLASHPAWPEIVRKIRARTPARIFVERGPAYSTQMTLELRGAHASAVDAVWTEFDLQKDFPPEFVAQWGLFQVSSKAESKSQFLLRPDLGRALSDGAKSLIVQRCPEAPDIQIVIGDGLSSAAVRAQVPVLFQLLQQQARDHDWSIGQSFAVRYSRVGIMNDIGNLLSPRVIVLLIGERPGLATAESLSAYMAYSPRAGHTDADRNLVSNIHARGVHPEIAANRITHLAAQMMALKRSGTTLKEETPPLLY
ncbi:MAG TPA: ethanolamine ammonia-lyase subunit EutC [Candidatus Acidoferrales bacterium]|jgi:ethanolamine ammonia-lyase small subunit|nr:ethanolamine ammonia-lyase subunit EutC [Candidatus Acidoferrales bacterium]